MNDPLDLLKDAWRNLDPPPLSDDLADTDATTRATVTWLRDAWRQVPVPELKATPTSRPVLAFPSISPLRAAAGFLFLSIVVGALQSTQDDAPTGHPQAALPTALDARLNREWNSFVVPETPRQASIVPPGALDIGLAAWRELILGSERLAGVLSAEPTGTGDGALADMLEAARAGAWSDAGASARRLLDQPDLSPRERQEALLVMVYSTHRLGHDDDAAVYLSQLEQELESLTTEQRDELTGAALHHGVTDWARVAPEQVGMNRVAVDRHSQLARESGADALTVVADGRVVSEWYASDYNPNEPFSFDAGAILSLLTGTLVADGTIADVDARLRDDIPELTGPQGDITWRQLLTHTAGYGAARGPLSLLTPLATVPGQAFRYSEADISALGDALSRVSGTALPLLAQHRLFQPLGLARTRVATGDDGAIAVRSTTRDMARIGQMVLAQGLVDGKQIVPAAWIDRSRAPGHHRGDAGMLWWLCDEPAGMAALGALDNNLYVFPDQGVVVVRGQRQKRGDAARSYEPEATSLFAQFWRD